jgi:GTP-binding protein LepA
MLSTVNIRNFCIIAHIDHGKSTLADRMLEITRTVDKRSMKNQFLDTMDLERERGITIKMQPVRMIYKNSDSEYILNLIDTPGHIDFSYEVSRALAAVEGAILLVDATKGVQAQTLANFDQAKRAGLKIVPVVNKIDAPDARIDEVSEEIVDLVGCSKDSILLVSAKSGEGIESVLDHVVADIPSPHENVDGGFRGLIFDSNYSSHKGSLAYVRVTDGHIAIGKEVKLLHQDVGFVPIEVGIFTPKLLKCESLSIGEIGYIATNIKDPAMVRVGDTIVAEDYKGEAIAGYLEPKPVVWANVYPKEADEFEKLKDAFARLRLNDAALSFETIGSGILGRSLRGGFLGMLHLEITIERIDREFGVEAVVASPTVEYEVVTAKGVEVLSDPSLFNNETKKHDIREPWFEVSLISRNQDIGVMMGLLEKNEGEIMDTKTVGKGSLILVAIVPLRKLVSDFFDDLKNVTQGYGSMSYVFKEMRPVELVQLSLYVAEEEVPQFVKLVPNHEGEHEARKAVDKLAGLLPRQLFALKIQGMIDGKIVASRTLSAMGKNVTAKLYGGDRSRKMKLWKKQKEGKKRLQAHGSVNIPPEVYLKMIKK